MHPLYILSSLKMKVCNLSTQPAVNFWTPFMCFLNYMESELFEFS